MKRNFYKNDKRKGFGEQERYVSRINKRTATACIIRKLPNKNRFSYAASADFGIIQRFRLGENEFYIYIREMSLNIKNDRGPRFPIVPSFIRQIINLPSNKVVRQTNRIMQ